MAVEVDRRRIDIPEQPCEGCGDHGRSIARSIAFAERWRALANRRIELVPSPNVRRAQRPHCQMHESVYALPFAYWLPWDATQFTPKLAPAPVIDALIDAPRKLSTHRVWAALRAVLRV